jgi:biotin synthase
MNIKSGGCSEDCAYCSQSSHNNASVEIREMASPEEIVSQAKKSFENNLIFSVVSSGRKLSRENLQIVIDALDKAPVKNMHLWEFLMKMSFGCLLKLVLSATIIILKPANPIIQNCHDTYLGRPDRNSKTG